MKTRHFIIIALAALTLSSCKNAIKSISETARQEFKAQHDYRDSEKWGKVVETEIFTSGYTFDNLQIDGNVEVVFTQDSIYSIKAYGNEKAIDEYQFMNNTNSDGTITEVVNLKGFEWNSTKENHNVTKDTPAITIYVTAPSIKNITVYGAGDIEFDSDYKHESAFSLDINGAGDFDAKEFEVVTFKANINGAGDISIKNVKCKGNADFLINGAGDIDTKLKCENAKLTVNGAGDIDLDVKCNMLTAECNGAGDIKLKGECDMLIKSDGPIGGIDSRDLKVNGSIKTKK